MQRWFDQLVVAIADMGFAPPPPSKLNGEEEHDEHSDHAPWHEMPEATSSKFMHVLTFPIKALVFTTTPNVLIKKNEKYYPATILISMLWLALFATLMTDTIEYLGCGIGVDGTVMGLSLGAIGTSFPNLYASILVARAGQGGMSICQAIASNTFNICICLALLWTFQTGFGACDYGSHGQHHGSCNGCYAPSGFKPMCPYITGTNNAFGSSAGSTKGAIIVSYVWCAIFIVTLVVGKLKVGKIPAYIMLSMYALYIIYQFVAAFSDGFAICFSSVNICI
jgi:Ca2+/Na+ antiporter